MSILMVYYMSQKQMNYKNERLDRNNYGYINGIYGSPRIKNV